MYISSLGLYDSDKLLSSESILRGKRFQDMQVSPTLLFYNSHKETQRRTIENGI